MLARASLRASFCACLLPAARRTHAPGRRRSTWRSRSCRRPRRASCWRAPREVADDCVKPSPSSIVVRRSPSSIGEGSRVVVVVVVVARERARASGRGKEDKREVGVSRGRRVRQRHGREASRRDPTPPRGGERSPGLRGGGGGGGGATRASHGWVGRSVAWGGWASGRAQARGRRGRNRAPSPAVSGRSLRTRRVLLRAPALRRRRRNREREEEEKWFSRVFLLASRLSPRAAHARALARPAGWRGGGGAHHRDRAERVGEARHARLQRRAGRFCRRWRLGRHSAARCAWNAARGASQSRGFCAHTAAAAGSGRSTCRAVSTQQAQVVEKLSRVATKVALLLCIPVVLVCMKRCFV